MKILFLNIISLLLTLVCSSQAILFKGQVNYKNNPLKNFTVIVNGIPATSDFSGVFSIPVNPRLSQLTVLCQDRNYIILYPPGGNVLIPKDMSIPTPIILGTQVDDPNLRLYRNILRQISESRSKPVDLKPMYDRLDSVEAILNKLNYSKDELRTFKERQDAIDLYFPEITRVLRNYIVQAIDVKNAFKYTADFAFTNGKARETLVDAIKAYNSVFEKLNDNYAIYSQKIKDNWPSEELKKSFDGIADTLLNVVHKKMILPLNDIKNDINQYFLGELPGNRNDNKIKIQAKINAALPPLNGRLLDLETRINTFVNELSAN